MRDAEDARDAMDGVRFHGRVIEVEFAQGDRKSEYGVTSSESEERLIVLMFTCVHNERARSTIHPLVYMYMSIYMYIHPYIYPPDIGVAISFAYGARTSEILMI